MTEIFVFLLITHWTSHRGMSIDLEPMPSIFICEQVAEKIEESETRGRHGFRVECIEVEE